MAGIGVAGLVGVEIRQRHHRDDLAGAHIHDDPGGALGAEILDHLQQFFAQDELHAGIERQLDWLAVPFCGGVEPAFDPGQTLIVDAAIAHDMRGQIPIGVEAALLRREIEPGNAEAVDGVLLAWGQRPLQIDKALAGDQPGADLAGRFVRQHRGKLVGGFVGVLAGGDQRLRIDEQRRLREHCRQQRAIAIDDIGAGRWRRRGRWQTTDMGFGAAAAQQHDLAEAQDDDEKDHREQRRGRDQAGAAGLEYLVGALIGNDRRAGRRRLEMARPTGIVVDALGGRHQRLSAISEISRSSGRGWRAAPAFANCAFGSGLPDVCFDVAGATTADAASAVAIS